MYNKGRNKFKLACVLLLLLFSFTGCRWNNRIEYRNPDKYALCRSGEGAKKEFKDKLGMDESIFPQMLNDQMIVKDFVMVYYNPFDPQYLGFLEVEYSAKEYAKECKRLSEYDSTEYIGVYGITGFSGYDLLAINADSYYGVIYAITDGNNKIVYVELFFCNYFMNLDYTKYIPKEYLPNNFNALTGNPTRQAFEAGEFNR